MNVRRVQREMRTFVRGDYQVFMTRAELRALYALLYSLPDGDTVYDDMWARVHDAVGHSGESAPTWMSYELGLECAGADGDETFLAWAAAVEDAVEYGGRRQGVSYDPGVRGCIVEDDS